jgi:class 3 adenylate cyclase
VKRVTYMSRFSRPLSREDIDEIGHYSTRRNAADGITGVLVTLGSVFFQIIEGDEVAIDDLYARVLRDGRHTGVICLQTEQLTNDRLFPDWSMNVIDLDHVTGDVVVPLKLLLSRLGEAQHILERYTQPAVSRIMAQGLNPLEVPLRKLDRVVLFTDMVGFSAISHRLPVEAVSELVGTYLETCSITISKHGGEVTKFLGDGVLAYFDVAAVDAAIQSCVDVEHELERIRAEARPTGALRLLFSGFGLALGPVIEGTLGSSVKVDYTIIGEPVNTAARVEALTRTLHTPILMTDDVCAAAQGAWTFAEAGVFDLGGDTPTIVRSLANPGTAHRDMRATVAHHLALGTPWGPRI